MTAEEIITRFGARLLSFGGEYIVAFADPSARQRAPELAARKRELVEALLARGGAPEELPPPAGPAKPAADRLFQALFRVSDKEWEVRALRAPSAALAHRLARQMAAREGMSLYRLTGARED